MSQCSRWIRAIQTNTFTIAAALCQTIYSQSISKRNRTPPTWTIRIITNVFRHNVGFCVNRHYHRHYRSPINTIRIMWIWCRRRYRQIRRQPVLNTVRTIRTPKIWWMHRRPIYIRSDIPSEGNQQCHVDRAMYIHSSKNIWRQRRRIEITADRRRREPMRNRIVIRRHLCDNRHFLPSRHRMPTNSICIGPKYCRRRRIVSAVTINRPNIAASPIFWNGMLPASCVRAHFRIPISIWNCCRHRRPNNGNYRRNTRNDHPKCCDKIRCPIRTAWTHSIFRKRQNFCRFRRAWNRIFCFRSHCKIRGNSYRNRMCQRSPTKRIHTRAPAALVVCNESIKSKWWRCVAIATKSMVRIVCHIMCPKDDDSCPKFHEIDADRRGMSGNRVHI